MSGYHLPQGRLMKKVDENRMYTIAEAAAIFNVRSETVRMYVRNGHLKAKRSPYRGLRMRWLIQGGEINRFLKKLGI